MYVCFPRPADSVSIALLLWISPFKKKKRCFYTETHFPILKTVPIKALNSGSCSDMMVLGLDLWPSRGHGAPKEYDMG